MKQMTSRQQPVQSADRFGGASSHAEDAQRAWPQRSRSRMTSSQRAGHARAGSGPQIAVGWRPRPARVPGPRMEELDELASQRQAGMSVTKSRPYFMASLSIWPCVIASTEAAGAAQDGARPVAVDRDRVPGPVSGRVLVVAHHEVAAAHHVDGNERLSAAACCGSPRGERERRRRAPAAPAAAAAAARRRSRARQQHEDARNGGNSHSTLRVRRPAQAATPSGSQLPARPRVEVARPATRNAGTARR